MAAQLHFGGSHAAQQSRHFAVTLSRLSLYQGSELLRNVQTSVTLVFKLLLSVETGASQTCPVIVSNRN